MGLYFLWIKGPCLMTRDEWRGPPTSCCRISWIMESPTNRTSGSASLHSCTNRVCWTHTHTHTHTHTNTHYKTKHYKTRKPTTHLDRRNRRTHAPPKYLWISLASRQQRPHSFTVQQQNATSVLLDWSVVHQTQGTLRVVQKPHITPLPYRHLNLKASDQHVIQFNSILFV